MRKLRRVPKDKKTGIAKKYLSGSRNRAAKAAEIKKTAELYKKGAYIDIKAVQKSRVAQDVTKKQKKTTKRRNKKSLKKKAEGTKFKYGELAAVYRKGQGAYLSGGSRNVPMAAWAMGRVNSYMRGDKARTVDMAIYKKYRKK